MCAWSSTRTRRAGISSASSSSKDRSHQSRRSCRRFARKQSAAHRRGPSPSAARSRKCRWRRSSFPTNVCEAGLFRPAFAFSQAQYAHAPGAGFCEGEGAMREVADKSASKFASMSAFMSAPTKFPSSVAAYFGGVKSALLSVFSLVLMGTYIGLGALAHDVGLPSVWLALSTILVWAAPAQLIMISALGTGGTLFEVALAVTLSATRLFPMVVALLPLLRGPGTRLRDMLLPTHFTSISLWVESLRLLPSIAPE